ncbi:unnamed protein product [Hymenolepis diminuta]|uniref:Uncharacterized protein n=1 Tax=Hymenolepis diminuta TaxID=6216 RepID=A0A0R3SM97_HYMDI|nr:unnamed protein product [Hymenolepis diminuta]
MDYIYIFVPICLSILIFGLTVGYLLFVKYRTNKLLSAIRRRLILERCHESFVAKPPDVTVRREPFIGVYREPSIPNVHQGYYRNTFYPPSATEINGQLSLDSIDTNSDVIEIPFQSYLPGSSPSSQAPDNYYSRSTYQSNYKTIEEGNEEFNEVDSPLGYREFEFADEFGPTNVYTVQSRKLGYPDIPWIELNDSQSKQNALFSIIEIAIVVHERLNKGANLCKCVWLMKSFFFV